MFSMHGRIMSNFIDQLTFGPHTFIIRMFHFVHIRFYLYWRGLRHVRTPLGWPSGQKAGPYRSPYFLYHAHALRRADLYRLQGGLRKASPLHRRQKRRGLPYHLYGDHHRCLHPHRIPAARDQPLCRQQAPVRAQRAGGVLCTGARFVRWRTVRKHHQVLL